MEVVNIVIYSTDTGKKPFALWFDDLSIKIQAIVLDRLNRIRDGNFGTCKPIKGHNGIYEIVIDHGPGYRIYYGKEKSTIVILLTGGEKKTQSRDIKKAYRYWIDYRELKK